MASGNLSTQVVGNAGLYYVCYELSKRGWNVLPTSRHAKGVDIVIYNQKGDTTHTIQVKALSKQNAISLGDNLENLIAGYFIICLLEGERPKCYILSTAEMISSDEIKSQREKGPKVGFWANNNKKVWQAFHEKYYEKWDTIGKG